MSCSGAGACPAELPRTWASGWHALGPLFFAGGRGGLQAPLQEGPAQLGCTWGLSCSARALSRPCHLLALLWALARGPSEREL